MRDASIDLEHLSADLRVVLDSINEGIHIVDTCGITVFYNRIAASLDNLDPQEVVGRHILSVFPSLSEDTSTLMSVLRTGRPAPVRQQTFRNYKGDTITTMNSTLPIYSGAKLIGAIEVSKDVTLVKELVERVVDLQAELITTAGVHSATGHRVKVGTARYTFDDIVAVSQNMQDVVARAKRASQSGSAVLIYGETGTGKELVVQSIHNSSPRAARPFIAQNCAALPETLLEGILFGTARGAFTGAENRPGLFEVADGGSLFLDEVDAMPLPLQAKLLRVLQEGSLRRIGESSERKVDVRLISAMSSNPATAVERNLIRRDLFFRLGVIIIEIPPLRKRKNDIPALTEHFIERYSSQFGVNVHGVTRDVFELFMEYPWPGNVRELQHAIEAAVQLSHGSLIGLEHLPPHVLSHGPGDAASRPRANRFLPTSQFRDNSTPAIEEEAKAPLVPTLEQIEKSLIWAALETCEGNISATARYLDIPRQTLQHKLKRYSIDASDIRRKDLDYTDK
ncbi:MAG: sigma 54-interacting transcriptional regulator [Bacillota bacterium]